MSWLYRVKTGGIFHRSYLEVLETPITTAYSQKHWGYSGHGEGVDNSALEQVHDIGPIPRGRWTIGAPVDHSCLGPLALPLTPEPDTNTFGRSGFYIHGDNHHQDRSASHGCIVAPREIREAIHESGDNELEVI